MDNNWLMAALQSPEGMNFLNMWRQKMGVSGTGGMNPGTYQGGSSLGTGGVNQGIYRGGGLPSTGGLNPGTYPTPKPMTFSPSSQGLGFGVGANDLAGQQQMSPMPMPYWGSSN